MPARNIIYPIFLPHAGCPFKCVYCNQNAVVNAARGVDATGKGRGGADPLSHEAALRQLGLYAEQIRRSGRAGEVAFYGGTFTALPRGILQSILDNAAACVTEGLFTGIRFSTRPDCMGEEICRFLSGYPVSTVELGVQSMSEPVLDASGRGYSVGQVIDAAARVRGQGWSLGIQLMAGLPEDSRERFLDSVAAAISIGPDFVRIYPTLVLKDTRLARSFQDGSYRPLALEEAVDWAVFAYDLLMSAAVPIARMGLHADPALDLPGVVLAGPHHPAFGYLVRCRWWRDRIDRELGSIAGVGSRSVLLRAAANRVSDIVGPKRSNIEYLKSKWELESLRILGDSALAGNQIAISF